ncbi:ABC transporter permease [Bauldia litoralis]|uniref:ABC transporter permease n=1 Tax=Bauldia litoralis TaxID=665467 RepID=UPI0032650008
MGILLVLIALILIVGLYKPNFVSIQSLANFGARAAWFGIIALGVVFLLSMGEIDLSTGSIYAFTINASAVLMVDWAVNPWVAGIAGVVIGVALGGINGILCNVLKIPVIIITLGTLSAYRGLTLVVSGGGFIYGLPREDSFFTVLGAAPYGVPMVIWVFAAMTVILGIVYRRTRYGFVVRAIGSNRRAAEMGGVPIARIRLITLMLTGGLCGLSGMLTLAFFSTADPNLGTGFELLAITAAIVGGTALTGGRGTVVGAALGSLVIAVIGSGIVQFGIAANWSVFVTGVMIIVAVSLDSLVRRRQGREA